MPRSLPCSVKTAVWFKRLVSGMVSPQEVANCVRPWSGRECLWAVGLTTVPQRAAIRGRTVRSLAGAGFAAPLVHEDDGVRAYGAWVLTLVELLCRQPTADLYAIFQDDVLVSRGLREYVEAAGLPAQSYANLLTNGVNEGLARPGWFPSDQMGKGACGLILPREAVYDLLSSRLSWERTRIPGRGHRNIDGAVCEALVRHGPRRWVEVCHSPSPLQHVGDESIINLDTPEHPRQPRAATWRGEAYNLLNLLKRDTKG